MSRLIDANANREKFKEIVFRTLNDYTIATKRKFNLIMTAFDNMPTAYDVEKVVHELREATKCNIDCYEGRASEVADYDDSWNDDIISACEAIKIVRKGGVE